MGALFRILSLAIIILFMGITTPIATSQTNAEATGKLRTHRFELEDYKRRYMLYSPANAHALKGPRPLVLVIHGGGSTDRGMLKLDKRRWNKLADQHGFYVAYPNAVKRHWDFGEGLTSDNLDHRVDDLAYFRKVIDDISARKRIDQRRVFATGISRGGQSSYYLACNMPERIRAVMPIAMSLPEFMLDECQSGPPVGIAIMNGTADPQVPYTGGWIKVFRKKRDIVLSTDKTLDLWRARNKCAGTPVLSTNIDKPGDKTSVSITDWAKCKGAPVKLYKIINGGHTWPSGLQYLSTRLVGETSRDISAADEGWKFFSQF
jgi:polyhydroxybutyrate depolymerase